MNKNSTPVKSDRFIPSRSSMNIDIANYKLTSSDENLPNFSASSLLQSPSAESYKSSLSSSLFPSQPDALNSRVLSMKYKAPAPTADHQNPLKVLYSQNTKASTSNSSDNSSVSRSKRIIPQNPERVLDAPDFVNDYYLNLLDWSESNLLAVALGNSVYLWNGATGEIKDFLSNEDESNVITSVNFIAGSDSNVLAVGNNDGEVQLWDVTKEKKLRTMRGHSARVGSLSWNGHILSSGSKDTSILHHDVRAASSVIATLSGHTQEVCGLKWSPDGSQLASGSNDNLLQIWNGIATGVNATPQFTLDHHKAAVKALAWCPFQQNLLASGGGTSDRCIKFWNTTTGSCLNSIDTKSQVCSLAWSKTYRELVSSHGYSQNQLCVWKYPSMVKMTELHGHTSRVLHLAVSPDGSTVASLAGDERLRFWSVWPERTEAKSTRSSAAQKEPIRKSVRPVSLR